MKTVVFSVLMFLLYCAAYAGWSDLRINESSSVNDSVITDENGEYNDWIELYNSGIDPLNLNGLFISDDIMKPLKWQITDTAIIVPAGSYFIIWADNTILQGKDHTNFKLDGVGEMVLLSSPSGVLIDSVTCPELRADISYGRYPDGSGDWYYFDTPTPGSTNSTDYYLGFTDPPQFSVEAGFYIGSQTVTLTPDQPADLIFYTLNYSDPNILSNLYSVPININQTGIIRAVSKRDNYLPGEIISKIYFINENYNLPVFATIIDSVNFYGPSGIYSHPWSDGPEWERSSQHHYFVGNELQFSVNSGIRIQGGNSVGMAKKSFRHYYESRYGDDQLYYPVFENINISSFKNLVLRAGYDDDITVSSGTLLRDPFSTEMWNKVGGLASASNFTVLFLNTNYWGIYNLRESINEYFIEDHIGTDNFDLIRYLKEGIEVKFGDINEWNQLVSFFSNTDFSVDDAYYQTSQLIDMDDFLNLLAFIHCSQFRSWTWGSFAFKKKIQGAKWKWTIWDTDRAYTQLSWNGITNYQNTNAELWPNFMPKNLLDNRIFKEKLINRTADFLNFYFKPENSIAVFDSLVNIIEDEIPNEKLRWNLNANWEYNVQYIRNFLNQRPAFVRDQILDFFALTDSARVTLNIEGQGELKINSLQIGTFPWSGIYFNSIPIELKAIPKPGNRFVRWDYNTSEERSLAIDLSSDISLTAYFIMDTTITDTGKIVINEIMYNTGTYGYSDDWIEIYNPGNTINLTGWILKDFNNASSFILPEGTYLYPDEYLIIARDINSFKLQFQDIDNVIGSFGYNVTGFGLSGSGDMVRLYDKYGKLVDSVNYDDNFPWPTAADGYGPSLQLINPSLDNSEASNWRSSYDVLYTPGSENSLYTDIPDYTNNSMEFMNIKIYPNPIQHNGIVEILVQQEMDVSLYIYDMFGRKIADNKNIQLHFGKNLIPLSITEYEDIFNGMYLLKVDYIEGFRTVKFLINK